MTEEELDRINRAEEIQLYTENRCETLEKEKCELLGLIQRKDKVIAELKEENELLKGRVKGFEGQILGLLYKYYEVYDRFPDLQEAMSKAKNILRENAELKEKLEGAEPREKQIEDLEKENEILAKALELYVEWTEECGIGWDNFNGMWKKWKRIVEEKGLGYVEGLIFMAKEEAKELLNKEA